jgi:4-alpha-glucanotransferase
MTASSLDRLAERYGIALEHWTMEGALRRVPDDAKLRMLSALGVDASSEAAIAAEIDRAGENELAMRHTGSERCYIPRWLEGSRAWGISLMLYELRSRRNWGIGDFADLADFARTAAAAGADFVGTNPLHALFTAAPEQASPFSPSSRMFLNPLYIAVDRLPGGAPEASEAEEIERLNEGGLVDYPAVCRLKLGALRRAFSTWQVSGEPAALAAFRSKGGEALRRHALFEALSHHMVAAGRGAGWRGWPEAFHDPNGEAVAGFAAESADEIAFHLWLQWVAATQLEEAAQAARDAGMRIGIYLDFAVGEAPDGSATWSKPSLSLPGFTIGAPPDMFTTEGQDWNLSPPNPHAMARESFAGFKDTLAALMASAGALRIDHVMALQQLFLVPADGRPADGAYLRFPMGTLLQLLADASHEHRTLVIGEDLGVVPSGFRELMMAANVLSYRILYFEQRDGYFLDPRYYPPLALACVSTHDMPTWTGWWRGSDIDLRLDTGIIDAANAAGQRKDRAAERQRLVKAMDDAGLLSPQTRQEAQAALGEPGGVLPASLAVAAHRMIARTPCLLAGVRLADLAGEVGQTNLPGTVDQYPNWRPRLTMSIEEIGAEPLFQAIAASLAAERPKSE